MAKLRAHNFAISVDGYGAVVVSLRDIFENNLGHYAPLVVTEAPLIPIARTLPPMGPSQPLGSSGPLVLLERSRGTILLQRSSIVRAVSWWTRARRPMGSAI